MLSKKKSAQIEKDGALCEDLKDNNMFSWLGQIQINLFGVYDAR